MKRISRSNSAHFDINGQTNSMASSSSSINSLGSSKDAGTNTASDDGFFSRPHTVTILITMLVTLFIMTTTPQTQSGSTPTETYTNTRNGLIALIAVFIIQSVLLFPTGNFTRPHPVFWKVVLAVASIYQLILVFLLFQDKADARSLMKIYDSTLNVRLPERSYATNCTLSYANVMDQIDEFVIAHVLGWVCKAIMFRDYWICWLLSVGFELLEYSLEFQLNNFAECWWDHWILDVLVCNWLGLEIGIKLCQYFEMKRYSWRGLRQIPTYTGKVKRAVQQFTPRSWTKFEWRALQDPKHFIMVFTMIFIVFMGELNAFYLKFLLWIPPSSRLNVYRLAFFFISGSAAVSECYQFVSDPLCKKLGPQAWMTAANLMTEAIICIKFARGEFTDKHPPQIVVVGWILFAVSLVSFFIWRFVINRHKLKKYD